MQTVREHPDLQNLRRFVSLIGAARGFYEKFGFTAGCVYA